MWPPNKFILALCHRICLIINSTKSKHCKFSLPISHKQQPCFWEVLIFSTIKSLIIFVSCKSHGWVLNFVYGNEFEQVIVSDIENEIAMRFMMILFWDLFLLRIKFSMVSTLLYGFYCVIFTDSVNHGIKGFFFFFIFLGSSVLYTSIYLSFVFLNCLPTISNKNSFVQLQLSTKTKPKKIKKNAIFLNPAINIFGNPHLSSPSNKYSTQLYFWHFSIPHRTMKLLF